jgi:F-type H+-transporting ATPase subunit b
MTTPTLVLLLASESAPVVDIDNTVFLQLILFLFLFVVLNVFLFKPWLELKERRAKQIGGATAEAQSLRSRARDASSEYEQRLAAAREAAMIARSESRRAAEAEEATIVGAARREATAELDTHKRALEQQAGEARAELGTRIDALAGDITKQILGRSV